MTAPTQRWLDRLWSGPEAVPGLELAEPALAQQAAVREVPTWTANLKQQ